MYVLGRFAAHCSLQFLQKYRKLEDEDKKRFLQDKQRWIQITAQLQRDRGVDVQLDVPVRVTAVLPNSDSPFSSGRTKTTVMLMTVTWILTTPTCKNCQIH